MAQMSVMQKLLRGSERSLAHRYLRAIRPEVEEGSLQNWSGRAEFGISAVAPHKCVTLILEVSREPFLQSIAKSGG